MAEIENDPFDVPDVSGEPSVAPPAPSTPEPTATAEPADPPAPTSPANPPPAQPTAGLPPALAQRLSRAGLRPIAGETPESAQDRLLDHLERRGNGLYAQRKELEQAHAAEIRALRESLDPIVREHYRRQREAETAALAAQIPEKGTPEYAEWLLEENLRAQEESRLAAEQERITAEQRAEEEARQEQIRAVDDWAYERVQEGLGLVPGAQADPEFTTAYDVFTRMALHSARAYFPDATDEQLAEFVNLSQTIDFRKFASMGADPREVLKGRLGELRRLLGVGQGAPAAGNGNGAPAAAVPAPAQAPAVPVPAAPATTPSPTAQRMLADSAASAVRAPVAVPVATRPGGMGAAFPDIDNLDEDEYVLAALNNLVPEDARVARHRKER